MPAVFGQLWDDDGAVFGQLFFADDNADTTPPAVQLAGPNPMQLVLGQAYVEPGFSAVDNVDGPIPQDAPGWIVNSNHNPNAVGSYSVTYQIVDQAGNVGTGTRVINVVDAPINRIIFSANSLIR